MMIAATINSPHKLPKLLNFLHLAIFQSTLRSAAGQNIANAKAHFFLNKKHRLVTEMVLVFQ